MILCVTFAEIFMDQKLEIMPTVFILNGYRFMFYSDDHEPVHVHVEKDGHTAKLNVEPIELVFNKGYKVNEIKEIESIVKEKNDLIVEKWNKVFKNK